MIHMIEFRAMGSHCTVQLDTSREGAAALQQVPYQVAAIEARLTRFKPTSELMQLNARAGEWVRVSPVLLENVQAAKQAARLTDGLVTPLTLPAMIASGYDRSFEQMTHAQRTIATAPSATNWREIELQVSASEVRIPTGSALDLGGTAKGWTAQHIAEELAEWGACLVNLGGDIVGRDAPQDLPGWPVEIEDPFSGEAFTTVYLKDASIATSGRDFRTWRDADGIMYHHIMDPRTGKPAATDALAVTVMHSQAIHAEAYAKAVLLQGTQEGLQWLNSQWHGAGLVFRLDGATLANSRFTNLPTERNTNS